MLNKDDARAAERLVHEVRSNCANQIIEWQAYNMLPAMVAELRKVDIGNMTDDEVTDVLYHVLTSDAMPKRVVRGDV